MLCRFQEQWEADYKKEFSLKPFIGRINSVFGVDSVEKIMDGLRKDQSEWAKQTLEKMERMSPTSLKLTFSQIQRGASLSLPDCLRMEYRITQNVLQNHDFFEGVRSGA